MINKAIQRTQKPFILFLSIAGAVIGLSLLMIVTQVYTNLNIVKQGDSGAINEQFLVIKKEIGVMNTMGASSSSFSSEEVEDIIAQKFVLDYAPFVTGRNFEVFAEMGLETGQKGSSLGFIESLPDKFIDVDPTDWTWSEQAEFVPIIMPTSFLDMYNFGLAESINSPKISKDMAGLLSIKIRINGNNLQGIYYGRVTAFSDRINSALVPLNFLSYANNKYGSGDQEEPSKVIIATANNKDPNIAKYLEENGYETNNEQLRGTIIERLIQPILTFTGMLCIIIIVMTILIFILYGEILIIKSKYDIHVLSLLGFKWKAISKVFNQFFLKVYGVITLISLVIFFIVKMLVDNVIKENLVFDNLPIISWQTILAMVLFLAMFISINIFSTRKQIKKIASGR